MVALAGPASAHAEVEAGFTELRVVLPEDIAPADVTLGEAPEGWKLKATDDGYTVGGPGGHPRRHRPVDTSHPRREPESDSVGRHGYRSDGGVRHGSRRERGRGQFHGAGHRRRGRGTGRPRRRRLVGEQAPLRCDTELRARPSGVVRG